MRAAESQNAAEFLPKKRYRKAFALFNKLIGITVRTYIACKNVLVPKHAHLSPRRCHGIKAVNVSSGDKHPFLSYFGKGIELNIVYINFLK